MIDIPCVVSIAGTDPSGGAGMQADLKTISATGAYAASIITALVAQNTTGVQCIQEIPAAFIAQQIDSVFSDLAIKAVKIGMLHDKKVIDVVADALVALKPKHVVFDPVMIAKNGCALLQMDTIDYLKQRLLPLCTLITPNLFEAEKLLNNRIETREQMAIAATTLSQQFQIQVLVKGGHLCDTTAADVLYSNQSLQWFEAPRINTQNTHGTGCTLSSAIASFLAQQYSINDAVHAAKHYLSKALHAGQFLHVGHGHGPVDHFYFLENRHACTAFV